MATNDGLPLNEVRRLLREPTSRGDLRLFTGAGFSLGARDRSGNAMPLPSDLRSELWEIIDPDTPLADDSSLQDVYEVGLLQARNQISSFLRSRLSVDSASVTDAQMRWLSHPWRRAYTVNVDDLEEAAERRSALPRKVRPISAIGNPPVETAEEDLLFIHLNGTRADIPKVTFSEAQYGERLSGELSFYDWLITDLLMSPVVFVGTNLHEPPFWKYLASRSEKGERGTKEHRPRSFFVSPDVPVARRRLLAGFNIAWVEATADEFAAEVLEPLSREAEQGLRYLKGRARRETKPVQLERVRELAVDPDRGGSKYLLGVQPTWPDLTSGRAIHRDFEDSVDLRQGGACTVVTGTAGAGTSTTLMRLALRESAAGREALWAKVSDSARVPDLARAVGAVSGHGCVFIDDADVFGPALEGLLTEVIRDQPEIHVVLGMRATRVDDVLPDWRADGRRRLEVGVPPLTDADIEGLLHALDVDNKLGLLHGVPRQKQIHAFEREAGRQLLVAMIKATSGEDLENKAKQEYAELKPIDRAMYCVAAIATDLRYPLTKDEIVLAAGYPSNTGLDSFQKLLTRQLITEHGDSYGARHRLVAHLVFQAANEKGELMRPYSGLVGALALKYRPDRRNSRVEKMLKRLIRSRALQRLFQHEQVREVYAEHENALRGSHHYWLQRGSFEVRHDKLRLARNYLGQARALEPTDFLVQTEWAYLLLREANVHPDHPKADEKIEEGSALLRSLIASHGNRSPYPFHVLASQLLAWQTSSRMDPAERKQELELLRDLVREGLHLHPEHGLLTTLARTLDREYLSLAIPH